MSDSLKRIPIALALSLSGCAAPGSTVIDCHQKTQDDPLPLREVIQVNRLTGRAALLSVQAKPVREGTVKTSELEYEIEFPASPTGGYLVKLQVNRYSGQGTYEMQNGASDGNYFRLIECKPYNNADRL